MIQATELRIGNWVVNNNENEVIIRGGGINAIETGMLKCKPIPLTEEWLLKFGFEHKLLVWEYNNLCITGCFTYGYCLNGYCLDNLFPPDFKYVHQLQNLYFTLTGEELNIKLYE